MKPYYEHAGITIYHGDCREILPQLGPESVQCSVTSPPYWGLRDYDHEAQIGLEATPEAYIENICQVAAGIWHVLKSNGTFWLNLGDSYTSEGRTMQRNDSLSKNRLKVPTDYRSPLPNGLKPKDLVGIPWRVAFALQADRWYLRSDIIWSKPNPMPESVTDRPTRSHEFIFLMAKSKRYYYDAAAIAEPATFAAPNAPNAIKSPYGQGFTRRAMKKKQEGMIQTSGGFPRKQDMCGSRYAGFNDRWAASNTNLPLTRNKRSVWTVTTKPFSEAHFATFPTELIEPCILAGCPQGGIILDPFVGAGTTLLAAKESNRKAIGIEINEKYCEIATKRLSQEVFNFG